MQGNARDSLGVTREAGRADEQQATFQGRQNSTVEHNVRVLVPCKDVVFSDWRPARNERQRLPCCRIPPFSCESCITHTGRCSMTAFASGGQVMCGAEGGVHVRVWGELHTICPEVRQAPFCRGAGVHSSPEDRRTSLRTCRPGSVSLSPSRESDHHRNRQPALHAPPRPLPRGCPRGGNILYLC